MLKTHRAGKGPGGHGGGGAKAQGTEGARCAPHPWSQRAGTSPGNPAGSPGPSGRGKRPPLLSCSSGLGSVRTPPACLSRFPRPPSYVPRTLQPGWGFGRGGTGLGAQQAPQSQWARRSLLPASPDLPSLRGADLVWPPLLLPPWSPYILQVHSGVPPIPLGVSPPPAAGRCPSCGETLTPRLLTPPSWLLPSILLLQPLKRTSGEGIILLKDGRRAKERQ